MRLSHIAVLAGLALLPFPRGLGCSCRWVSISEAVKRADVVFRGRVQEVTYIDPERQPRPDDPRVVQYTKILNQLRRYKVTFTVSRWWKGHAAGPMILYERLSTEGDCVPGPFTQPGQEWFIFARRTTADDSYRDVTGNDGIRRKVKQPWDSWLDVLERGQEMLQAQECSYTRSLPAAGPFSSGILELLQDLGPGQEEPAGEAPNGKSP